MKYYIKKKVVLLCSLLCLTILSLSVFTVVMLVQTNESTFDVNKARILTSDLVYEVQSKNYPQSFPYEYSVFDLKGQVVFSTIPQYPVNETINLQAFSYQHPLKSSKNQYEFLIPIIIDGVHSTTLLVYLPVQLSSQKPSIFPYILICILLLVLFIIFITILLRIVKHDILLPITQLHTTTKNILDGKYDSHVTYDYDGEIGSLCHDFEAMRDELEASKHIESKMHENEKLLLACISHDLKTPLASIMGYVEGIRDGIVKDKEGLNHYTSTILRKVQMLSKLIDDILEHSKTELNEFSIEPEEVYSEPFFLELFADLSIDIYAAELCFSIGDIPNVLLSLDKKRITQVVQNIIANAIKYTSKNGHINVKFEIYNKSLNSATSDLVISISDDGAGINAEDIPFIFDKFYRGEKARTLNIAGSGLGLAISHYIILNHGGRIECDSLLNSGTTIRFSLPIQ